MHSIKHKLTHVFSAVMIASLFLASCSTNTTVTPSQMPPVPSEAAVTAAVPPTLAPDATATNVPTRTLVACVPVEPQTLYIYGGSSPSMWSILEAVYDGPFDTLGYSAQPVILNKIPSLADGDASIQAVPVQSGSLVLDADGSLVSLAAGTRVLPSGCTSPDCAVQWDGQSDLSMDQLVVTFQLRPGLTWSDGTPLTAQDSVFSYQVAADPATPASKYLTDRTESYTAQDDQTAVWTGLPGFYEQRFGSFFWTPLPRHILGERSAGQLLADPQAAKSPLGWGPYVIEEWVEGDHITLRKNPNYFRTSEGLPKFDTLVIRFVGDPADGNLNALLAGECDVVDQNAGFLEMFPGLVDRETEGKLKLHLGQGPEWEHIDFGIRPASYDNGYNPGEGDRLDFFGDVRTRQAFAYCIDRASINANLLYGRSTVPASFLPANHPLAAAGIAEYAYNPQEGQALLDAVGWRDHDSDTGTPRVASGVAGVADGTQLIINYATTEAGLRQQAAQMVASSLNGCGIGVQQQIYNAGEIFAPGPDGLVFGRKFDLVQFSWEASARPNCLLYASTQIPNANNHWIGANVAGYSNPDFDAACAQASQSRATDADYAAHNQQVQTIFAETLPVLPLYAHLKIAISRPDLCGLNMDVTARSILYNLEAMDYGEGCP